MLESLELFAFVSGVRALVVLPAFAAAGGDFFSVPPAVVVSADSAAFALFDFFLLAVLSSAAAFASPAGGVALAEGSTAALFLVRLFFLGALLAVVSPADLSALAVSPAAFFDLLVFLLPLEVAPDALVEESFPAALSSAATFFLVVFFDVVDVADVLSAEAVESVESAAGFFFFFFFLVVVVESLCV
ncbi:MAG: hypothetical protein M3P45_11180 [Acidobacteriota bacterium]|nr:hypothetical protein [Acidobacteriota bacterium]